MFHYGLLCAYREAVHAALAAVSRWIGFFAVPGSGKKHTFQGEAAESRLFFSDRNEHCSEVAPTHESETQASPPGSLLVGNSSGVLVLVLRAGQDRVGQSYIQVVVVLDQGDVFVVEHEILEG